MKTIHFSFSIFYRLLFSVLLFNSTCFAQTDESTGSDQSLDPNNKGVSLIKEEKYEEANKFFTEEIKKNETDANAYFNRGTVLWHLNDETQACKDWSYLLALGDTAAFKLLDSKCHGAMVIEGDTLHSAQYHKMWAKEKTDDKTMSSNSGAWIIVDEMPRFPGGTDALIEYLQKNVKYPAAAKENNIRGTVVVNFIVSTKGKVLLPYVKRGLDSGCNKEAVRVIKNMPAWIPGKQNGKPVLVLLH